MLSDLNLPPLKDRCHNIRLAYFYKVVEGVVPAITPQKYLTSRNQEETFEQNTLVTLTP
jgi:hypothetical protein